MRLDMSFIEVLILGCERSGSTWLANIFDSHPRVNLFMEPFAQYAGLFPGFPDRNVYLEAGNAKLISNDTRVVVDFKKAVKEKSGKKSLRLFEGDRIYITKHPTIVDVNGAVHIPGYVKYVKGKKAA